MEWTRMNRLFLAVLLHSTEGLVLLLQVWRELCRFLRTGKWGRLQSLVHPWVLEDWVVQNETLCRTGELPRAGWRHLLLFEWLVHLCQQPLLLPFQLIYLLLNCVYLCLTNSLHIAHLVLCRLPHFFHLLLYLVEFELQLSLIPFKFGCFLLGITELFLKFLSYLLLFSFCFINDLVGIFFLFF